MWFGFLFSLCFFIFLVFFIFGAQLLFFFFTFSCLSLLFLLFGCVCNLPLFEFMNGLLGKHVRNLRGSIIIKFLILTFCKYVISDFAICHTQSIYITSIKKISVPGKKESELISCLLHIKMHLFLLLQETASFFLKGVLDSSSYLKFLRESNGLP